MFNTAITNYAIYHSSSKYLVHTMTDQYVKNSYYNLKKKTLYTRT